MKQITLFELRCPRCSYSTMIDLSEPVLTGDCQLLHVRQQALQHVCKPSKFSFVGRRAIELSMAEQSRATVVKLDIENRLRRHRGEPVLTVDSDQDYDKILIEFNLTEE